MSPFVGFSGSLLQLAITLFRQKVHSQYLYCLSPYIQAPLSRFFINSCMNELILASIIVPALINILPELINIIDINSYKLYVHYIIDTIK